MTFTHTFTVTCPELVTPCCFQGPRPLNLARSAVVHCFISTKRSKVKSSLCFLKHHGMKRWGSGGIAPLGLNFGTRWIWVISFKPRPLYPRYPLDRRLGGPRAGRTLWRGGKIPAPSRESNPGHLARSLITIVTELPRLFHSVQLLWITFDFLVVLIGS